MWQYLPKQRGLTDDTRAKIRKVMDKLNHPHGKGMGFRIPCEALFKTRTSLTISNSKQNYASIISVF